jgi:hypothetical protein
VPAKGPEGAIMASIYDTWHKSRADGTPVCKDHGQVPSARHGNGERWQARWFEATPELEDFIERGNSQTSA